MAEREKLKVAVYGAGNFCKIFFDKGFANEFIVMAIIDSNKDKIGTKIYDKLICTLDEIQDFDRIIITAKDKDPIFDKLISSKISPKQIWYFDGDTDELKPYVKDIEHRFLIKSAVEQICKSLLLESYYANEYTGFKRIIVLGNEWQYLMVKDFFDTISEGYVVVPGTEARDELETDKYIIACEDYRNKVRELRNRGTILDEQWIILPIFDIKASIL